MKFTKILRTTIVVLFILASFHILFNLVAGGYDFFIGKFHLSSHKVGNLFFIQLFTALLLRVFFFSRKQGEKKKPEIQAPFLRGLGRRFAPAALVLLIVLSVIAYGRVLPGFFLSDDFEYLSLFARAPSLSPALLFGYLKGFGLLRPLSILSLYADFRIWHFHPFGYHLTNLALHLINASLLLFIVFILSRDRIFSLAGAALFSIYPIHPEAVSWISGRFDVLCAAFYLLAVFFFLLSSTRIRKFNSFYFFSLAAFLSALLSKEMALSLPLVLLLVELSFRIGPRSQTFKERMIRHLPFWLMEFFYLGIRFVFFHGVGGYAVSQGRSFFSGLSVWDIRNILFRPLPSLFLPLNFSLYPHAALMKTALLVALSIAILFLPFRKKLNFPLFFFGFCLIPLTVLPALKIFFVSPLLEGARFLYLPSLGACLMMTAFFGIRSDQKPRAWIGTGFLILFFLFFLFKNNASWTVASGISEQMTHQASAILKKIDTREPIYVLGLPDNYQGAYIFRNGFASAISLFTGFKSLNLVKTEFETSGEFKAPAEGFILEWKMNRFQFYRIYQPRKPVSIN